MFKSKWFQVLFDESDSSGMAPGKIDTTDERAAFDSVDKDDKESETEKDNEGDENKEDDDDIEDLDKEDVDDDEDKDEEKDKEDEEDDEDLEAKDSLIGELKAKNKNIFKEFPELRPALYREQQFTALLSSPEEAKEVLERAETFDAFQEDISKGNVETLLAATKEMGSDTLTQVVASFLPALEKIDKELHFTLIGGEVKKILKAAFKHAQSKGDNNLRLSAENINWFLFGDDKVEAEFGIKPKEKDAREEELDKRERIILERAFKSFSNEVVSTGKSKLMKRIERGFGEKPGLNKWQLKKVVEEIHSEVEKALTSDQRHRTALGALWKKAEKDGFSSEHKDSIISAYLSRATSLIPSVRQRVLKEAGIKLEAPVKEKEPIRISGGTGSGGGKGSRIDPNRKIDYSKTSEEALLRGEKPVYRS